MAEDNDAASKTEEPTPRKLQQAREKGDVVKTPDLSAMASLAAGAAVVAIAGGTLARNLAQNLTPFFAHPDSISLSGGAGVAVMRQAAMAAAPFMGIVMAAACVAGVGANLLQTGFMFTPEKLALDFSKLSPMGGFKRLYNIDGLMQFFKSLVKVGMTGLLAWWVVRPHVAAMMDLSRMEPGQMLPFAADILRRLVFAVAAFLLLIAGADWFWQRQRFMSRMRMSKEETKEDYKQTEGDPHIKAKLRQMRNDRARRRMMQAVPTATVVIMNPTHYAVALKYDASETPAPLCVAKGMDLVALKIRAVAEEAGVTVIEDAPLARALYAAVEIDDIIPPAHYEAVAKIIGFVLNGARRVAGRVR